MAFIDTTPASEATGEVRELYERQQGALGFLPNYAKVFCHRPDVMQAWASLQVAIRQNIDTKSYGLITIAAAMAINSSYCSLAHGKKLIGKYYTPEELSAIITGDDNSPLTPAEKAMMRLAGKVAQDSSTVIDADIQELQGLGFSDGEIFDIVAAAAGRCFFAKVPDALGAQPDSSFNEMAEPLRELLTVGRPISAEQPELMTC